MMYTSLCFYLFIFSFLRRQNKSDKTTAVMLKGRLDSNEIQQSVRCVHLATTARTRVCGKWKGWLTILLATTTPGARPQPRRNSNEWAQTWFASSLEFTPIECGRWDSSPLPQLDEGRSGNILHLWILKRESFENRTWLILKRDSPSTLPVRARYH